MKYSFIAVWLMAASGVYSAMHERITTNINLCENPFPGSVYDDARATFPKLLASSNVFQEMPEAVRLHNLIIEGFDEDRAQAICDGATRKRMLSARIGKLKITAAHVAAIMQDLGALHWLAREGADLKAKDKRSFTPAHFAALGRSRECLDYIQSNGTDTTTNEFGATPEQLWQLTHLTKSVSQSIYFADLFSKAILNMDGNHFCLFTEAYFAEGIKQTPESVLQTWAEDFEAREILEARELTERIKNFKPFPGRLYLQNIRPARFDQAFSASDFLLHANSDFDPGDVVETNAGLWAPERNSVVHNIFAIQTDKLRGYLAFANSTGLPNVVMVQFFNRLGLSQGHFAMAIRAIKKGDTIVRERFASETVLEDHPEDQPQALDQLLLETPFAELPKSVNGGFNIKDIRNRALLKYMGDNPATLVRLRAEEKISTEDLKKVAESRSIALLRIENGVLTNIFDRVITVMDQLFTKEHIRRFFAKKARQGQMIGIIRFFDMSPILLSAKTETDLDWLWEQIIRT